MNKTIKFIAYWLIILIGAICFCFYVYRDDNKSVDNDSSVVDTTYIDTTDTTTNTTTVTETESVTTTYSTYETTETEETTQITTEQITQITTAITTISNKTKPVTQQASTETVILSTETLPVSEFVETTSVTSSQTTLKSYEEIAEEVWHGLWGSCEERKTKLELAGYDYNEVQKYVAKLRETFAPTNPDTPSNMAFVKTFSRGTYYCYGGPRRGGSGRQLISCGCGNGAVKGSIASSYLYRNFGYNYNGKRTMVYLEISGYPAMNGYYYLDDSDAGNTNVIDFFYITSSECLFRNQGVVSVNCYIVNY